MTAEVVVMVSAGNTAIGVLADELDERGVAGIGLPLSLLRGPVAVLGAEALEAEALGGASARARSIGAVRRCAPDDRRTPQIGLLERRREGWRGAALLA